MEYGYLHNFGDSKFEAKIRLMQICGTFVRSIIYLKEILSLSLCSSSSSSNGSSTVEYGYLHHFGDSKFDAKMRLMQICGTFVV